jgi:hypothetical protein
MKLYPEVDCVPDSLAGDQSGPRRASDHPGKSFAALALLSTLTRWPGHSPIFFFAAK